MNSVPNACPSIAPELKARLQNWDLVNFGISGRAVVLSKLLPTESSSQLCSENVLTPSQVSQKGFVQLGVG